MTPSDAMDHARIAGPAVKQNHAIGRRVLRLEDGPLLRGQGRFVDDLKFSSVLEAAFVRSPHAHAGIRGIDTAAARRLPFWIPAFAGMSGSLGPVHLPLRQ